MADRSPTQRSRRRKGAIDGGTSTPETYEATGAKVHPTQEAGKKPEPKLFHKVKHQRSILALVIADSKIYAGTEGGEILVWSLETCQLLATISAHRGSVLGLAISQDGKLLFSSAGDALVNVWCTSQLTRLYSIYSTYDVGDVFCVAYSAKLQTVYLGAQNTSIQWYDLSQKDTRPIPDLSSHPSQRNHRFFDSKGPGGVCTPRPETLGDHQSSGGQTLEIHNDHIIQYAHHGYVYCMLLAIDLHGEHQTLISGGGDGVINLWPLGQADGGAISHLTSLENGDDSVLALALDRTILYSGRLEGAINVWDLDTCQLIRRIKAHSVDVLTLAVGHGSIFSGASDGVAKRFNSRCECINRWEAHGQLILASAATTFNGKEILVTGGNDDCFSIWNFGACAQRSVKRSTSSNEELIESIKALVAFPTVSSKPEYAQDCRRGASLLRSLFKKFGANTEMLNTEGNRNPVVLARFPGKNRSLAKTKRILFYGHYDVVPAENKQQTWNTNPFDLQGINGYLYGRGVSDNKGPILAAIYAVADLVAQDQLNADVIFLIEGEEESGSRGFQRAIQENKHLIGDINWILLANSYWLDDKFPCLTYGLRGVVHATVQIDSDRPDLHSGVDGSYLLNEAVKDLIAVIATLTSPKGDVQIPGFYDFVLATTEEEDDRFNAISRTLLFHDQDLGDAASLTQSFKARWTQPSLTVHHIKTSGPASSSVIPRIATAALSIRLVPKQNAMSIQKALEKALHNAFGKLDSLNKMTVTVDHKADPWLGDPSNQIFQTLEEAITEAWNMNTNQRRTSLSSRRKSASKVTNGFSNPKSPPATSSTLAGGVQHSLPSAEHSPEQPFFSDQIPRKPLYIREGGSIPAIRFLEKEFNAPAAHLPCGQASDSAHLDNERLRISNLYKSREIFRKVFRDLPLKE